MSFRDSFFVWQGSKDMDRLRTDTGIAALLRECSSAGTPLTLGEALDLLGERSFGALFVLLALPAALPLPAAGYAVPFGLGIFVLGIELIAGRSRPWLPARILKMKLPSLDPDSRALALLERIEGLFRARGPGLHGPFRAMVGLTACCLGGLMMIPIPGTNTLPGACALVMGMGILYRDGLWTAAGMVIGAGLLGLYGAAAFGVLKLFHLSG